MIKIFPFIFVILWSSAFVTTKPIIDNSDPFAALAFRFFFVALGFFLFSIYIKQKIIINLKNLIQSFFIGVLFCVRACTRKPETPSKDWSSKNPKYKKDSKPFS